MNIKILLIVLLDFLKMKDEYRDLDQFLLDNYHEEFIRDFFIEYEKLNSKIMVERSEQNYLAHQKTLTEHNDRDKFFEYV